MAGQFCQSYNFDQMLFIRAIGGIGIPMGCIITEAIEIPIPPRISWGVEFQLGMENPIRYWNSDGPIAIPRIDLIATQRSGE